MEGMVITILGLGLVVTKLVDSVRNAVDPEGQNVRLKLLWNVLAFGFGILVVLLFEAAGFKIEGSGPTSLATGLLVGATASGWHEVLDRISPR